MVAAKLNGQTTANVDSQKLMLITSSYAIQWTMVFHQSDPTKRCRVAIFPTVYYGVPKPASAKCAQEKFYGLLRFRLKKGINCTNSESGVIAT